MKHLASLFCLLILLFGNSCKKENNNRAAGLEGIWELRSVSAMLLSTYPPGNGHIISFTSNKYEIRDNGQLTRSGEFEIVKDMTAGASTCLNIRAGEYTSRIIYDNNINTGKTFFELSGNKLTIISGCFAIDAGSSSAYERQ